MSTEHIPLDATGGGAIDELPRIDKKEFDEAFEVFSDKEGHLIKENLPLFLKSIGLGGLRIEEAIKKRNELNKKELRSMIARAYDGGVIDETCEESSSNYERREWPSHTDVLRAFAVFDQEGHGSIPVQQLKRFLLQAQLGFQEEELEKLIRDTCKIDNDNQISYKDFVDNVWARFQEIPVQHSNTN